jgi:ribonuclease III
MVVSKPEAGPSGAASADPPVPARLPHRFADPSLLELALTHASVGGGEHYERLEFLGDAVLDLIVCEELYRDRPGDSEGELTIHKGWVVSREILAEAALRMGLDGLVRVGHGLADQALPRSILAGVYEAVLGAVHLDAGYSAARDFALATLAEPLAAVREGRSPVNPKQALQERAQKDLGEPPTYVLIEERGEAHARAFLMAAEVGGRRYPAAWGRTRKEAERWAAHEALLRLEAFDEAPGDTPD